MGTVQDIRKLKHLSPHRVGTLLFFWVSYWTSLWTLATAVGVVSVIQNQFTVVIKEEVTHRF